MAVFTNKPHDLVFDAWAVPRAHALHCIAKHGVALHPAENQFMRAGIGVRDPARQLRRVHAGITHEAGHGCIRSGGMRPALPEMVDTRQAHRLDAFAHPIARLLFTARKINGAAVDARRCAGFEPPLRQLQFLQPRRQPGCRWVACTASRKILQAYVDASIQKRARRKHHGMPRKMDTALRNGAGHPVGLHHQVIDCLLEQPQIGLVFQLTADGCLVQHAVGLGTGGTHGRTLAAVEHTKLDAGFIYRQRHGAIHGIHFFHKVALANAAHTRIAAHLPQCVEIVRQQQGMRAHARSSQRGFGAGMPAANHDHIKLAGIGIGKIRHG